MDQPFTFLSIPLLLICLIVPCVGDAVFDFRQHFATATPYSIPPSTAPFPPKAPETCSFSQLNLLSRHGARFPTNGVIKAISQLEQSLQVITRALPAGALAPEFEFLREWKNEFSMLDEELLTQVGINELSQMGARMISQLGLSYNPRLVRLRSTEKPRAGQSASSFSAGAWTQQHLFPAFFFATTGPLDDDPLLRFYDTCPMYEKSKSSEAILEHSRRYFQDVVNGVVHRINEKLGVAIVHQEMVPAIWNACKYETTVLNKTRMCEIFSPEDILHLEFVDDLRQYWQKGYGASINYNIACPLITDIIHSMESFAFNQSTFSADLRFAHAGTLMPLLCQLGLYKDDFVLRSSLTPKQIASRKWRTSKISPFSGNIALVLYRCGNSSQFVAVVHNERLVKQPLCSDQEFCELSRFLSIFQGQGCNFRQLCGEPSSSAVLDHNDVDMRLSVLLGISFGIGAIISCSFFAFFLISQGGSRSPRAQSHTATPRP